MSVLVERQATRSATGRSRLRLLDAPENQALGPAIVLGALLLVWVGHNGYHQTLLVTAVTYALIALGMYVPFVLSGSLSLAYGAYASIGGYSLALISAKTGLPIWLAWLIGPPISAFAAVILGLVTRRLSGFYLVAVTLLFSEAFQNWLSNASFTQGDTGLSNFRSLDLFGWKPSYNALIIASVALVVVVAYALDRLRLSPWGISVRAMREVPAAVEATGVRVPSLDLVALALGAAIGSFGGLLFAQMVNGVQPDDFTVSIVFLAIFMPIIGGTGTPWGAVLGALIVVEFTVNIPSFQAGGLLLISLAVLVTMLVAPRGILSYLDSARHFAMRQIYRGRR
jgi:branched-chain amino acid transport system permease protein